MNTENPESEGHDPEPVAKGAGDSPKATKPSRVELTLKIIPILISLIALGFGLVNREEAKKQADKTARAAITEKLDRARDELGIAESFYLERPQPGDLARLRRAEETIDRALTDLAANPDAKLSLRAYIYQAALYFRKQPRSKAYEYLAKAQALDPLDPTVNYLGGLFHHLEGHDKTKLEEIDAKYTLAVESYNKALGRPSDAEFRIYYNLGAIAMDRGDVTQALLNFEKSLLLRDYDPDLYFQIGAAYLKKAKAKPDFIKSIDASSKAIEYRPIFPSAYFHRGWARLALFIESSCQVSEYEEAKADFTEAIRLYQVEAITSASADAKEVREKEADARDLLGKLEKAYVLCQSLVAL